jgi:polyisoprenoid-binding protein YceI
MSWNLDPGHAQVNFSAKHMGIMTVRGDFTDVQATLDFNEDDFTASSVEATIQAASLMTNDSKRDDHLRSADFLDVEHYPTITFKSTRIERAAHERYRMTGDLTIHGVTRPVTLEVVYSGQIKDPWGNTRAGFSAETTFKRSDWGLNWNAVLETGGLLVSDDIKIAIEVEAVKPAAVEAAA